MDKIEKNKILVEYDPETKIVTTSRIVVDKNNSLNPITIHEYDLLELQHNSDEELERLIGGEILLRLRGASEFLADKNASDEALDTNLIQQDLIPLDKKNAQEIYKLAYEAMKKIAMTLMHVKKHHIEYKKIGKGTGLCSMDIQTDIIDVIRERYPDIDDRTKWE